MSIPSDMEAYFHDILIVPTGEWFFRYDHVNYVLEVGATPSYEVVLFGDKRWHDIVNAGDTKTTYLEGL